MKKYLLYSMLGAVSLFSAACNEDFNDDVAAPQQWEQEEAITLPGFTAQGATELNLADAGDSVTVFTASIDVTQLPEGATLDQYRIQLTADKENATPVTITASNDGKVLTSELQAQIEKDFGKRPDMRTYNAVVYADVMQGTQASLLEAKTTVTVAPKAPFIDKAYYIVGNMCDWKLENAIAFSHSEKDVYDDPVFTVKFSTTGKDCYWKIAPQTVKDAGNLDLTGPTGTVGVAVDGDTSLEGKLTTTEPKAGKIEKEGMYKMTINMMEGTYKIEEVGSFISTGYYLIGDMCSWNTDQMISFNHSDKDIYDDPVFSIMFSTTKDNSYWKVIPQSNVDAGNPWAEGPKGVLGVENDGDPSLVGNLVAKKGVGAGMIEKAGLYKMTINMKEYSYQIVAVAPEYYLVGALQGWHADKASDMTCMLYPKDVMNQSYTTKWEGDGNLKIWMGNDFGNWDKAMGTEKDGDQSATGKLGGGGAIKCPEPGTFYTFAVDFSKNTYTWTKLDNQEPKEYKAIGLIGNFNGWGGDAAMTQVTPHNWYLQGLTINEAGEIKFRADNDWKDDWGGGFDLNEKNSGVLVYKGANMKIAAGTYNVFMNDITGEFVFKKL